MKVKQSDQQTSDLPKLASPAQRALATAGIQRLAQLTKLSESEVKQLHGIGPNALEQLVRALRAKNMSFANKEKIKRVPAPTKKPKLANAKENASPSQRIASQIAELTDWRGKMLAALRALILETAPGITEEWKWGTPVWSHHGNVVSVGIFKDHVKLTFFNGAFLDDPNGLFNAGLDAKTMRSVDFNEGDKPSLSALKKLIRTAVAYNNSNAKKN
jgi:hypothetical protein